MHKTNVCFFCPGSLIFNAQKIMIMVRDLIVLTVVKSDVLLNMVMEIFLYMKNNGIHPHIHIIIGPNSIYLKNSIKSFFRYNHVFDCDNFFKYVIQLFPLFSILIVLV